MINMPSLLYENTGYTRQAHSFQSWKVCFGTAEPLSYFFTNEFTFSSTPASAASRIVRSVQHLFLSQWWLWGGHSHIHKPVIHCAYDSSALHTGWEELIRHQKWNTQWKQKSPHDFTSNFSGNSFSSVPGHKTATINWSVWVLSNSTRSSQEIYSHTRKFAPLISFMSWPAKVFVHIEAKRIAGFSCWYY